MNTHFLGRTAKTIAVAFTAAVLLVGNPLNSRANDGGIKKSSLTEDQLSIKYLGNGANSIIFKVEFDNPTAEKFWLIVKNDNGEIVYHQQFNDVHFAKSVVFQNTDTDIHPTFVIRTANNSEITRQYQVNKTLIENTVVTRL